MERMRQAFAEAARRDGHPSRLVLYQGATLVVPHMRGRTFGCAPVGMTILLCH